MFRLTKKRLVLGAATVCALVVAAAAYAYFTSTGSGTATATVGSSSALTLHGTVAGSLYPGSTAAVSFTVDNGSSGKERVGTISLSELKVDAGHSGCSTVLTGEKPNFSMAPVAVNTVYGPGNGQTISQSGTLKMNETEANQDACQGATLTLVLTSN